MARVHSKKDWAGLKAAYRRGEGSIAELSPKFAIAKSTAEKRCATQKWQIQRQEVGRRAEERAIERDVESLSSMLLKHRRAAARVTELTLQRLEEAVRKGQISAGALDTLSGVLARMAPLERLSAGIEPAKPVKVFDPAGEPEVVFELDGDDEADDGLVGEKGTP